MKFAGISTKPRWSFTGRLGKRRNKSPNWVPEIYQHMWVGFHLWLVFLTSHGNFLSMGLGVFHKIKFSKLFSFWVRYQSQLNNVSTSHSVKRVPTLRYSKRKTSLRWDCWETEQIPFASDHTMWWAAVCTQDTDILHTSLFLWYRHNLVKMEMY